MKKSNNVDAIIDDLKKKTSEPDSIMAEPEPVNIPEPLPIKKVPRFKLWQKVVGGVAIVALLIGGIAYAAGNSAKPATEAAAPVVKTSTGQTTWQVSAGDYGDNRWFTDGIEEIKNAKNDAEAKAATYTFLEKCKTDANRMVGLASFFLGKTVDKASLVDEKGYATDSMIQLYTDLSTALATAHITLAEAPANGVNSGINSDGTVVQASSSGIDGDRKAAQIDLANGQTVWVMARCGNPVTAGSVGLPTGATDNPSTPSNPTNPTNPTDSLTPKSSNPADYPYPRGDDGTTDSGTGVKPPVSEVTTPAETTPPTVETTVPGGGGVIDTPTSDPGSETGVTAPDVEEPPVTTPVVTIPVEPGANSGTNTPNNTTVDNPFS